MRRLLCLFRGHQWDIEENYATQGTEQVSTTLESDAVATLEDEATGLVSSLPGSVCGCWGGCRCRGLVVGSWRL
jgi:hypothetical protein